MLKVVKDEHRIKLDYESQREGQRFLTFGKVKISNGLVHTNPHNSKCVILPEEKFPDQGGPPKTIPSSGSEPILTDGEADLQVVREWTDAIRGGRGTFSDFTRAAPVTEFVLLGNIATRLGQPLEYDPVAGRITNNEEANQWIHLPRREGWAL